MQKTLEDANIKLDSVLSDLMGKSGRAMIEALIAGETNPAKLAALADRRVKASHEEFREARFAAARDEAPSLPAAPSSGSDQMLSMQLSPRSTRKWRRTLDPFAPQSS